MRVPTASKFSEPAIALAKLRDRDVLTDSFRIQKPHQVKLGTMRLWSRRVADLWSPPMAKGSYRTIYRDSEDGQIVKQDYAEKHPRTTEKERVYVPAPKKDK